MLYWHYWRNIKSNPIKMKYYGLTLTLHYFFGVAQRLKRLPGMQETRVRSLGREDPLEKGRATHSSILVWRIPWREEPGRLQSMRSQRVRHDWVISLTHDAWGMKLGSGKTTVMKANLCSYGVYTLFVLCFVAQSCPTLCDSLWLHGL